MSAEKKFSSQNKCWKYGILSYLKKLFNHKRDIYVDYYAVPYNIISSILRQANVLVRTTWLYPLSPYYLSYNTLRSERLQTQISTTYAHSHSKHTTCRTEIKF